MAEPKEGVYRDASHPLYEHLQESDDFQELRHRYRGFAIPWTVAFLVWYLTYVVLSNWATGFMSIKLVGNINVALVFGLAQFVTTFLIAWLYSKHSQRHLDPLAARLRQRFEQERDS